MLRAVRNVLRAYDGVIDDYDIVTEAMALTICGFSPVTQAEAKAHIAHCLTYFDELRNADFDDSPAGIRAFAKKHGVSVATAKAGRVEFEYED